MILRAMDTRRKVPQPRPGSPDTGEGIITVLRELVTFYLILLIKYELLSTIVRIGVG